MKKNNYVYNENDIIKSFRRINLKKNDNLFITTSLGMLGDLRSTTNVNEVFFKKIIDLIGSRGTLFVPTYSYSFGKKKNIFNVKKTKSSIGDFGNFVLKQNNIYRSKDPMLSIVGIGPKAKDILRISKNTSYGRGCIFERMLNINLKILNIGLGSNWIPFIHYLDYLNKVPFRYNKYFRGYIVDINNKKKKITWHYPVRNFDEESRANGHILGKLAEKKKIFTSTNLGRGRIFVASYKRLFKFTKKITFKDKYLTSYYKLNELF